LASFQIINVISKKCVADITERTFSENVGAQQNSIHNELDSAELASAGKYFIAYKIFLLCFPFTIINFMHTWDEYYTNTTLWVC
jgi:hypothetical protein